MDKPLVANINNDNNSIKTYQALDFDVTMDDVKKILNLTWKISHTVDTVEKALILKKNA